MIASLLICSVLYIAVAAVMTGLVPYRDARHAVIRWRRRCWRSACRARRR